MVSHSLTQSSGDNKGKVLCNMKNRADTCVYQPYFIAYNERSFPAVVHICSLKDATGDAEGHTGINSNLTQCLDDITTIAIGIFLGELVSSIITIKIYLGRTPELNAEVELNAETLLGDSMAKTDAEVGTEARYLEGGIHAAI